jgi:glutaminase
MKDVRHERRQQMKYLVLIMIIISTLSFCSLKTSIAGEQWTEQQLKKDIIDRQLFATNLLIAEFLASVDYGDRDLDEVTDLYFEWLAEKDFMEELAEWNLNTRPDF